MKLRRRAFLGATSAAVLAPFAAGAADTTPLEIVVAPPSGTDAAGLYYAIQQGWFQQAGIHPSVLAGNGAAAIPGVIGGSVQVGYANVYSLCQAHLKGVPITLVAPGIAYTTQNAFQKLLVNGDAPIHTQKDLVGKIVAVSSLGDMSSFTVQAWLTQAGVDATQVRFVELKVSSMPDALLARRVDAIAVYDPFMSAALARGARTIGKPFDSIALSFLEAAWFSTISWATEHREIVLKFASVLHRGALYFNSHYNDLIPMISDFTKLTPEVLRSETPETIAPVLTPASIQPVIDAAAKYHAISGSFSAGDFIFS